MKIVLDLKLDRQPKENDVIIYKDGKWTIVSRESFLAKYINENRKSFIDIEQNEQNLDKKIDNVNEKLFMEIERLQKDLVTLAKIVKEK